ncbi:MAG TPA: glycoside hydrolase family 3 protein, partial [Thermoanaerobaculia bacterium]
MGMRFLDTTFWPSAMAIAATGDPSLAEREGRVVAEEARAVGVNQILAPVADVNVDPDNPVINSRSFGEDPQDVARYVAAFIRGVESEHAIATAKHFPGHGDTHVDSHISMPAVTVDRQRLERVELVPFRAAIAADVKSVMIGHLSVPSIDPSGLPATVSAKVIEGVLRDELGFKGLVVSDAFDMGGLTEHFDAGEAAIRGIEAGEDQILLSADTDAAIAGVKAAVKSGRLTEARIDASVRRILAAKEFAPAPVPDPQSVFRVLDSKEHRDLAEEIARRALTLVREQSGVLPLPRASKISLIIVSDFPEANPMQDLDRELRARGDVVQTVTIDPRTAEDRLPPLSGEVAVIAFAVRARSGAGSISVPAAARRLVEQASVPAIGIAFGSPYLLREVPKLGTYICAYGIQPVMQVAATRALFGETRFEGRLPVTIPGLYARGDGIKR